MLRTQRGESLSVVRPALKGRHGYNIGGNMNFQEMKLAELREYAKGHGIRGISTMKKSQLISLLEEKEEAREADGPSMKNEEEKLRKTAGETEKDQVQRTAEADKEQVQRAAETDKDQVRTDRPRRRTLQENETSRSRDRMTGRRRPPQEENLDGQERPRRRMPVSEADLEEADREREGSRTRPDLSELDSGEKANGILEVIQSEGFGFIRCENYLSGDNDVYVSPTQIRKFNLKTGDMISGKIRVKNQNERYSALLFTETVNGYNPYEARKRPHFENLTPVFPDQKISLEYPGCPVSMRMVDLLSPIGRGQRGMIVSQPKTGKTTLLKQIATSITTNHPDMKLIVLLIDERPEEVTDIRESIEGPGAEVIYSTFDENPEHHRRVSEMVLERAKRLVEHKEHVVILLDSITRLSRAYNLLVPPSGRTLSGGLDPTALYQPKKFFGAARNMREGGSLTILATALVETGSKMDDVVFEEFKGTGNMELVLDRKLSERRIFPAINIQRSGTRRDDLLLNKREQEINYALHREMSGSRAEENMLQILDFFKRTRTNDEFIRFMDQNLKRR